MNCPKCGTQLDPEAVESFSIEDVVVCHPCWLLDANRKIYKIARDMC